MSLEDICKELEHFETPQWAAEAILDKEVFTQRVEDVCAGTLVLTLAARAAGHTCSASDIRDWGVPYEGAVCVEDFLTRNRPFKPYTTVFINPPFSKACQFIEHAKALGAFKIVCFQRFAWWESRIRRTFWEKNPPCRVYICGDRTPCWRHDIPKDQRKSSTPTAHAWFVWQDGAPSGTLLSHIWRDA